MRLLLTLLFFYTIYSNAQDKSYIIKDEVTRIALADVTVDLQNGYYLASDENGSFTISSPGVTKVILSHLGYKTLTVVLKDSDSVMYIEPNSFNLDEVVVGKVKRKMQKLMPKVNASNLFGMYNWGTGAPLHFNCLYGIFIPNDEKLKGNYITKVVLTPTDYRILDLEDSKASKQGDARYSPFKVNLYAVDTLIGIPASPLFKEDFTVWLKEGEKYAVLELAHGNQVLLPQEGLFIVISAFDKTYYEDGNYQVKTAPAFHSVGISKKSNFKQYIKNLNRGENSFWERDKWFWDNHTIFYCGFELEERPSSF